MTAGRRPGPSTEGSGAPEPQAAPQSSSKEASTDSRSAYHLEDAENSDSVAAYMEQLLSRTRRSNSPASPTSPGQRPDHPAFSAAMRPRAPEQPREDRAAVQADAGDAEAAAVPPAQPPRPRRPHDKDALRANLDSMREVANLSARSALERHAFKRVRGMLFTKSLLAAAAFVISAVIFSGSFFGIGLTMVCGWGAAAIGVVVLVDMFRSTLTEWARVFLRNWKKRRVESLARLQEASGAESGETISDEQDQG
jgi:hypothetical protein